MNVLIDGQIVLTGTVGDDFWGDGFTYSDVMVALAELGRTTDVVVRINSGGGYATDGAAIHSLLKAHQGRVSVVIEGLAASAASIIAMAGDDVAMRTGALMMVHDPATITFGDAAEHEASVTMLKTVAGAMADIYAEKTGRPVEEIRAEMAAETWLSAEDAVAKKYADRIDAANANEPTAFAYRIYAKAPERIVALADQRGWAPRQRATAAAPVVASTPPGKKEKPMADQPGADTAQANEEALANARKEGAKAAAERFKAVMALDNRKGREALADHLVNDTEMGVEAIDKALAAAPKGSNTPPVGQRDATASLTNGADGEGRPDPKAGWDKAVARVNARLG